MTKSSTAFVLAARSILLVLAAALAFAGFVLVGREERSVSSAVERYVCPMHAEVTSTAPSECPICRMALERVTPGAQALEPIAGAKPPDSARSADNSYAPGATWLPETFPPAHRVDVRHGPPLGTPQRRVFIEPVRAAAWLEAPGRLAAVLYRDELVGLSPGERGTFFGAASPRTPIEVHLSEEPPTRRDGSTSLVRFSIEERARVAHATGAAPTPAPELRRGDVGWIELPAKARELLTFPEPALLRSSQAAYVLVPGAHRGAFTRRPVEVGRILDGRVVVFSGLEEGDRIVVGDAFFLDAQRRFESGTNAVAEVAR